MKKLLVLVMICILVIASQLTGCSTSASNTKGEADNQDTASEKAYNPASERHTNDALIVASEEGFTGNFLPYYAVSLSEINISDLTFSQLLDTNSEGDFVPDLANIIEVSDDKRTFTLKLRDDATFSDGVKVTTKDVAFSFNTLADPSYDGPISYLAMDIEGYDEYYEDSEGVVEIISGINIVDELEFQITFYDAYRTNLETLSAVSILPEHYYGFEKGSIEELKSKVADILGSGPYTMTHYEPAQYVELTVNENYFGDQKPQIKKVIAKVTQSATVIDELIAGTIDIIEYVSNPDDIETIKDVGFIDLLPFQNPGYSYIEFNCKNEPTSDKNVRQALVYGLDRQSFVDGYYQGLAEVQDNILYTASWGYSDDVTDYAFNPEKAIELLEASGWILGDDGYRYKDSEKLVIELSSGADNQPVEYLTPIMIENYKNIGVELLINYLDFNSLSTLVFDEKGAYDMYTMGVSYGSKDPNQLYADFHSDMDVEGGYNASCYNNEAADALLDDAVLIFDKEEAKLLYQEWAKIVTDDMPRMILASTSPHVAINSRVKGHKPSAFVSWSRDILNMYIEE